MRKLLLFLILLLTISLAQAETLSYDQIDSEIKEILDIPDDGSVSIILNQQVSDIPVAFESINSNYLPEGISEDDVLITSGKINLKTTMKFFTYQKELTSKELTLIKRSVQAKLTNYNVIEEIPTTIAQSIDNLYFKEEPEVISSDPLVISAKGSKNSVFYYIVEGNAIDIMSDFNTVVAPSEPITVKGGYKEPRCGDGVCTSILEDKNTCPQDCTSKLRWGWIIFLIAVLTILVIVINKIRKKKKALPSKNPFKTPNDEQNLRNYVKTAKAQGKQQEEIKKVLLAKAWTQEQVDYIFKTTEQPTKRR